MSEVVKLRYKPTRKKLLRSTKPEIIDEYLNSIDDIDKERRESFIMGYCQAMKMVMAQTDAGLIAWQKQASEIFDILEEGKEGPQTTKEAQVRIRELSDEIDKLEDRADDAWQADDFITVDSLEKKIKLKQGQIERLRLV